MDICRDTFNSLIHRYLCNAVLDIICNARCDSVIYDLAPEPTGKRGMPAKHGRRLSIWDDFVLSDEKIGEYYTGVRRVLTNIFGAREVLAYVTSAEKDSGSRRLFFSTVFPEQLYVFCAWQEKAPLNQTGSGWMQYIPLFLYAFRWGIMPISALFSLCQHFFNANILVQTTMFMRTLQKSQH